MSSSLIANPSKDVIVLPKPLSDAVPVIDIRGNASNSNTDLDLKKSISSAIQSKNVKFGDSMIRSIPTMVLYDDKGLQIFDKITYSPDYYLTMSEIDVFVHHASEMAKNHIPDNGIVVELGCGAMRKTKYILDEISKSGKTVTYYAVDLSSKSLSDSLEPLKKLYPTISFVGLWGTYDDSLLWLAKNAQKDVLKVYLWLGSSIGNLTRSEAADFLNKVSTSAMNPGDVFFCGIDRRNLASKIALAYDDTAGLTRDFIMNGLVHVNTIFGEELLDTKKFAYKSIYNEIEGRHEAYYVVLEAHKIISKSNSLEVSLTAGEMINVEYSYKYSESEVTELVRRANMTHCGKWTDSTNLYDLHYFGKK